MNSERKIDMLLKLRELRSNMTQVVHSGKLLLKLLKYYLLSFSLLKGKVVTATKRFREMLQLMAQSTISIAYDLDVSDTQNVKSLDAIRAKTREDIDKIFTKTFNFKEEKIELQRRYQEMSTGMNEIKKDMEKIDNQLKNPDKDEESSEEYRQIQQSHVKKIIVFI